MNSDTIDAKTEQIEFFGKDFKISEITNPHLRKLLKRNAKQGYSDYSRHTDRDYQDDWNENYYDHSEYYDVRDPRYAEYDDSWNEVC